MENATPKFNSSDSDVWNSSLGIVSKDDKDKIIYNNYRDKKDYYIDKDVATSKMNELIATKIEFPADTKNTQAKFFYAHYSRYQTDYEALTFKNGVITYAVFTNFDGESNPKKPLSTAGVTIKDKKEIQVLCQGNKTSNLANLEGLVTCDPDDAMNMGVCK